MTCHGVLDERVLAPGAHVLDLRAGRGRWHGTLRVEWVQGALRASADLYAAPLPADPPEGLATHPRSAYCGYLSVGDVEPPSERGDTADLHCAWHRYDAASTTWAPAQPARVTLRAAGSGRASGTVSVPDGSLDGTLDLRWASPYVRRAVVEIDCVAGCEPALCNTSGADWRRVFDGVGWDLAVVEGDEEVPEPTGESWSTGELHAALLERRAETDLDREWRYWLICVRRLDDDARGVMFDRDGGDADRTPREGAGLAAHWTIPDTPDWGRVRGLRFGTATDPYFRTALHEIGHAMGLQHNSAQNGIMSPTDEVARSAVAPQVFPDNIGWVHAGKDAARLRHLPDPWIRPGGLPFGRAYGTAPALPEAVLDRGDGLRLAVRPLHDEVPIGAPVRVEVRLHNDGDAVRRVPAKLSMKTGRVTGEVEDPAGCRRPFRSVVIVTEPAVMTELAPGGSRSGWLTLLRGNAEALFPVPGPHRIRAAVTWTVDGAVHRLEGEGVVHVAPAVDGRHARTADLMLHTSEVALALAVGGDHLEEGNGAIAEALADPVLRPHVAFIEARRVGSRFRRRRPDPAAAAAVLRGGAVLSPAERQKLSLVMRSGS